MVDDMQKMLLDAYAEESVELVGRISAHVVAMEHADEAEFKTHLTGLRRDLHTLKGASSAVGLDDAAVVCHRMEDALAPVTGPADLRPPVLHGLIAGQHYLERVSDGEHDMDAAETLSALDHASGTDEAPKADAAADLDEAPASPAAVSEPLPTPPAAPDEPRPTPPAPELVEVGFPAIGRTTLPLPVAKATSREEETATPRRTDETMRVPSSRVDSLRAAVGDLIVAHLQDPENVTMLADVFERLGDLQAEWSPLRGALRASTRYMPRREAARMERRVIEFGAALQEEQSRVFGLLGRVRQQARLIGQVSDELDVGLRRLSMTPVQPWLTTFGAAVRDAARATGRKVRLAVAASDIEVGRAVMEQLREPLLHLLRNAVAHGIEPPEERLLAGKGEVGTINCSASRIGMEVEIVVQDDGAGIDREAVGRKAVTMGLVKPGTVLDDDKVLDLICGAGLSTTASVGGVAGRGVGMDVVLSSIDAIGGRLAMRTESGLGTRFEIRVPTTLAAALGVVIRVGRFELGIPARAVERVLAIGEEEVSTLGRADVLMIDGSPVALHALSSLISADAPQPDYAGGKRQVVVLRHGRERLAITVDDIIGDTRMVVRPLGAQFAGIGRFAGCALRPDGSVLPVLESDELFDRARGTTGRVVAEADADEEDDPNRVRTVLVVDDSLTTRTLERNVLAGAGYRVVVASDGVEGLDMLQAEDGVDLIVSDIDMPNMDGYEMCRQVRAGPYSDVPILVVTSRGSLSEKQKGLDAGADGYVIKGEFEQGRFLNHVRRLLDP